MIELVERECLFKLRLFVLVLVCGVKSVYIVVNGWLGERAGACWSDLFKPGGIVMRRILAMALCSAVVVWVAKAEQAPAEQPGMRQIFNGKDLSGWDGDPKHWSVKDGLLRGESTPDNPARGNTFLIWTAGETKDFELRLTFRCNAANNSGIQYRSQRIPSKPDAANRWRVRGYQHEIRNEHKMPNVSGFIYDEGGKRGRIILAGEQGYYSDGKKTVEKKLITQEEFSSLMKVDEWNDVVIIAKGNHIRHYLNNRLILDFKDNDPELALTEGILALQLHGGKPMWVEFKSVRIRDL